MANPSGVVRNGRVYPGQSRFPVRYGPELTGMDWARSHLVSHWLPASPQEVRHHVTQDHQVVVSGSDVGVQNSICWAPGIPAADAVSMAASTWPAVAPSASAAKIAFRIATARPRGPRRSFSGENGSARRGEVVAGVVRGRPGGQVPRGLATGLIAPVPDHRQHPPVTGSGRASPRLSTYA